MIGRCLCGAVAMTAAAPPRDVHHCHCGMCRRATGAAFATLAWFPRATVTWKGAAVRRHRSSSIAERGFCGRCGTPLFLSCDRSSEIAVMAGILNDARPLRPSHHYGTEGRLPWADIGPSLPGRPTADDPTP